VGTQLAMDVQVFFAYRLSRYMLPQSYLKIPLLVPVSVHCSVRFLLSCREAGQSVCCTPLRSCPACVPTINMPF